MKLFHRIRSFLVSLAAGYEPVMARTIVAAFFVMLAGAGIGSGSLPPAVEAVLGFLAIIAPIVAGKLAREKVTPVEPKASQEELLPPDLYSEPDASETEPYDPEQPRAPGAGE
jgi:hypothetical protein